MDFSQGSRLQVSLLVFETDVFSGENYADD
jgi:hypothetical protein